jgi:hypothetical protein
MDDRIRRAFDEVHAEEELKQTTASFLQKATHSYGKKHVRSHRFAAALSAAAAALILLTGGYYYAVPVSAITLDVNPSLELEINRMDQVVSLKGMNEDGRALASDAQVFLMNYRDALEKLMASEAMKGYLNQGDDVSITILGESDEKGEEMLNEVSACGYAEQSNVTCECASREDAEAAEETGLPLGKYRAFLELQKMDPSVTAEEVRGMSMKEIRTRIGALEEAEEETEDGAENGEAAEEESTADTKNGCQDESCAENGNGSMNGSGNGSMNGSGSGSMNGSGNGSMNGSGNGSMNGSGSGSMAGSGNGHMHGSGHGNTTEGE